MAKGIVQSMTQLGQTPPAALVDIANLAISGGGRGGGRAGGGGRRW